MSLGLAMSASVAWGCADFLAGLKSRKLALLTVLAVSQVAGLVLILPVALAIGEPLPGERYVLLAVLAGAFNAAALAAFYRGLSIGAMGIVAPIVATDAVIPVVFGIAGGERPATLQGIGIVIALVGVVAASRPEPEERREDEPPVRVARGVGLALVAAICFGCFVVALDGAAQASAIWAVVIGRVTTVSLVLIAALAARVSLKTNPGDRRQLVLVGGLDVGATTLFAVATTLGLLSYVGVLGALYPVITVLLARVVLRERLDAVQRAGTFAALGGAASIAAG